MAKTVTESQKAKKSRQPINTETNRKRKLAKHVRRHPNDKQASGEIMPHMPPKPGLQSKVRGLPGQETVANEQRPPRFKQTNEEHLGLVRISAKTLLKLHEYKNILLGSSQSLSEANSEFSTDPLK